MATWNLIVDLYWYEFLRYVELRSDHVAFMEQDIAILYSLFEPDIVFEYSFQFVMGPGCQLLHGFWSYWKIISIVILNLI